MLPKTNNVHPGSNPRHSLSRFHSKPLDYLCHHVDERLESELPALVVAKEVEQRAVAHKLSDYVEGLLSRAHRVQLDEVRMVALLHNLRLSGNERLRTRTGERDRGREERARERDKEREKDKERERVESKRERERVKERKRKRESEREKESQRVCVRESYDNTSGQTLKANRPTV